MLSGYFIVRSGQKYGMNVTTHSCSKKRGLSRRCGIWHGKRALTSGGHGISHVFLLLYSTKFAFRSGHIVYNKVFRSSKQSDLLNVHSYLGISYAS